MELNFPLSLIIICLIWLVLLTVLFWNIFRHYNRLIKIGNGKPLQGVLDNLLKELDSAKMDIDFLRSRCDTIEKTGKLHIQKIGLLRFNPFKDTGGDQSFILTLVDAKDTGVVISGLYSRSGTRWYAKRVVEGKGIEHNLSKEEEQALKESKALEK